MAYVTERKRRCLGPIGKKNTPHFLSFFQNSEFFRGILKKSQNYVTEVRILSLKSEFGEAFFFFLEFQDKQSEFLD